MTERSIVAKNPENQHDWLALKNKPESLLTRVKRMIVNGKNLSDGEALALVDFSLTNDLNPLIGEAYCIPNVGCTPGDAGWKRKASEQLWEELEAAGVPDGYYHIDYRQATHDEADFDESLGDIAWVATLYDSLSRSRWRKMVNDSAAELRKIFPGESFFDLMEEARKQAGSPPEWSAVGVVHGAEKFSKSVDYNNPDKGYKPEMWDRNERAKKRARKQVLRSRFSNAHISAVRFDGAPANGEFEEEPSVSGVIDTTFSEETKKPSRPAENILSDMGFDVDASTGEVIEPEKMSVEAAGNVTRKDGKKYLDCTSVELAEMQAAIKASIEKNGLSDEQKTDHLYKLDAIDTLLAARKAATQEQLI